MASVSVVFVCLGEAQRSKIQRPSFPEESQNRDSKRREQRDVLGWGVLALSGPMRPPPQVI
jgi:hypothetical protein